MLNRVLILVLAIIHLNIYSQCLPNSIYQDSTANVWPATGFPDGMVGVSYYQYWDIKAPSTLIEAALGDTAFVTVDTLGQSFYIGDWPVDSVVTIDIHDLPPGVTVDCNTPNCTYLGGEIGCANIYGVPNTAVTYSTDIISNLYSHGVISINVGGVPLTLPVSLDYFSITGKYDTINRYTINILDATSMPNSYEEIDIQNIRTQNNITYLDVYSNIPTQAELSFVDLLGRKVHSETINLSVGNNQYTAKVEKGIYIITLQNRHLYIARNINTYTN